MTLLKKLLPVFASLVLLQLGTAHAEMPQISDARIVQPPPGAKVAAAYFTINNTSGTPLTINSASSDAIGRVEIHLSSVVDDVAKMEKQDSVTVPAGESLQFMHGSYHLMLMGLGQPLQSGHSVNIVLETSAGPLPIAIPILTPDEAAEAMSDGTEHHDTGKQ